jgi:hypothetical protein
MIGTYLLDESEFRLAEPVRLCNGDAGPQLPDVVLSVDARVVTVASRVVSVDPRGNLG